MFDRLSIGAAVLAAALSATTIGARAHDESKFPDLKGQWVRADSNPAAPWDPSKPPGRGQQAPLTPEYQAIFDSILAKHGEGGRDPLAQTCIPPGMPRSMIGYEPIEFIVMPDTTYIMLAHMSEFRRIFTNDRKWTDEVEPAYGGFSIGKWEDTDADGKADTLVVETRGMKGTRTFDASGIPLHKDNETVVKERIYLDKSNPNLLHNEVTTIDNALSRPWTVTRSYRRDRDAPWIESVCSETNPNVMLGDEMYSISEDGFLSPTRKDQPPPDLRYFQRR
jgi:hypothetical protein